MDISHVKIEAIRLKRTVVLLATYDRLCKRYGDLRQYTSLSPRLVVQTVAIYLAKYEVLVTRDKIPDRIQRHKVAGLMASSIVKTRPVQLLDSAENASVSRDNEFLALWCGILIIAEPDPSRIEEKFLTIPNLGEWFRNMVYLLSVNAEDSDWISAMFSTISLFLYPENFGSTEQ